MLVYANLRFHASLFCFVRSVFDGIGLTAYKLVANSPVELQTQLNSCDV